MNLPLSMQYLKMFVRKFVPSTARCPWLLDSTRVLRQHYEPFDLWSLQSVTFGPDLNESFVQEILTFCRDDFPWQCITSMKNVQGVRPFEQLEFQDQIRKILIRQRITSHLEGMPSRTNNVRIAGGLVTAGGFGLAMGRSGNLLLRADYDPQDFTGQGDKKGDRTAICCEAPLLFASSHTGHQVYTKN
jgi:hypothetical protein